MSIQSVTSGSSPVATHRTAPAVDRDGDGDAGREGPNEAQEASKNAVQKPKPNEFGKINVVA